MHSHFCSKNINVFENTLATTVNKFVNKELIKLTILGTTGPRLITDISWYIFSKGELKVSPSDWHFALSVHESGF